MPGQAPGRCRAQTGGAAGDDRGNRGVQLHGMFPFTTATLNDAACPLPPIAVAQWTLVKLAGGKPRQFFFEVDGSRAFDMREVPPAEGDQLFGKVSARSNAGHWLHQRLDLLAE